MTPKPPPHNGQKSARLPTDRPSFIELPTEKNPLCQKKALQFLKIINISLQVSQV
jgi:hypothetical protein